MKKIILFGTAFFLLLLILVGCGGLDENPAYGIITYDNEPRLKYDIPVAPNELMRYASPMSTFIFFVFDGETTLRRESRRDIDNMLSVIEELSSVPAARVTGWTISDITLPIFGFRLGTWRGESIRAAWSNGFLITRSGDVYRFDFDFEEFNERQRWSMFRDSEFAGMGMPNQRQLALDDEGWHTRFLAPAVELADPPEGIEMALVSNTNYGVTVAITNHNEDYWFYGLDYGVHMLLDGVWYNIPMVDYKFIQDIGLILGAGQTDVRTYSLHMYGELLPGTFRLVVFGMYVIFDFD